MINYHIKLLSTHDLRLKQAIQDKSLKSRAVLNLMGKIWELKDSPEELKKAVALFGELSEEREDFILYVLDYLEAMQVITFKSWREFKLARGQAFNVQRAGCWSSYLFHFS